MRRFRIVLAWREVDPRTDREGDRADLRGLRADENANVREACAEGRLHLPAHGVRQRPPGRVWRELKMMSWNFGRPIAGRALNRLPARGRQHWRPRREDPLKHARSGSIQHLPSP